MATVALLAHPKREAAATLAAEAGDWLAANGHTGWLVEDDDASLAGVDLAVSLGGDGTMLRTIHRASPVGIPVLGVNVGHLGYLTAVEPGDLITALGRCMVGDYEIEERMTLAVEVDGESHVALNEAVSGMRCRANTVLTPGRRTGR